MTATDPRARHLAEHMHLLARRTAHRLPAWNDLPLSERTRLTAEARVWLQAAVEAGLAPTTERPTDRHDAVWVDDEGLLYAEYRTTPESDAIGRLVWANEQAQSKTELEERGAAFRLLGWCL
ncbi:hypothetical protein [Streptomyces acidiscabies]|uniref:Uncharacterized protein n=1 Tax=Streptomyces acidiscabies TaxID=42234 RepID=A0ABU4LVZ4_9ACTN|nr:hypothetical protein [Streptomyces acidiscabies]MDX3019901.1 hypothetical protein [Streptomyces acidiscabies]